MEWQGGMTLGRRLAGAVTRIGIDRLAELRGAALPRTAQQLARADVINAILDEGGIPGLARVRRASLPGVGFESSNCLNFLVAVEWDESGPSDAPRPATLYAKLPCRELGTRAFANAVGFWAVECAFARNLAARVPIRVPRVFSVVERGARFVLLLENLQENPGTQLFANRDMAAGTTVERARLCLETFAELHAAFWEMDKARRAALFPLALHTYLAPGGRALTRALNASAIGPAHRAAPDVFSAAHASICRRATQKWDTLMTAWYSEPLTLIHGDSHLANCFEMSGANGPRMGMIDFQGMQWCHGVRDVQYFLINSLEPDLLAAHESELIDCYRAALSRSGIDLGAADALDRYRVYAFQTLMVAVVSLGLGSLTERDETVRAILARSVAAIDRLGFEEWLDRN